MEYFFLFLFGWLVVLSPVVIYALVIERRRRNNASEFQEQIAAFQRQLDNLERRTRVPAEPARAPQSAVATAASSEPVVRIIPQEAPGRVTTEKPSVPQPAFHPAPPIPPASTTEPTITERPAVPITAPPLAVTPLVPAPPVATPPTSTTSVPPPPPVQTQPKVTEVGGIPLTPRPQPAEPAKPVAPPPAPRVVIPPAPPAPPPQSAASASHTTRSTMPAEKKSISLEERLGISWAATIGTVVVVVGVVSYTAIKWEGMPNGLHVTLLYLLSAAMLGLGIFLERKDLYKILGRVL